MVKVFVLTIGHNTERQQDMKLQFKQYQMIEGEHYEFVYNNIDLDIHLHHIAPTWRDPHYDTVLRRGELGCAIGHIQIWKQMLKFSIPSAIVLEDDVLFQDSLIEHVTALCSQLTQIHCSYDWIYLSRKKMTEEKEEEVKHLHNANACVYAKYSYWTNAYVITYQGAKKLLTTYYENNIIPVDEFVSLMFDLSIRHYFLQEGIIQNVYNFNNNFIALALRENIVHCKPNNRSIIYASPYVDLFQIDCPIYIVTVATDDQDNGYQRFITSCKQYGFQYTILGLGKPWLGGDMTHSGGGYKINLLKEFLHTTSTLESSSILLFTDSYDVILNTSPQKIHKRFQSFNCNLLFAAEKYCYPNKQLASQYPPSTTSYGYLNSGGILGSVADFKIMLDAMETIHNQEDDQLAYTQMYLNHIHNIKVLEKNKRRMYIELDTKCQIFQCNLYNSDLTILETKRKIRNNETGQQACILHGNGSHYNKIKLNSISNYLQPLLLPSSNIPHPVKIHLPIHLMVVIEENMPYASIECIELLEQIEQITILIPTSFHPLQLSLLQSMIEHHAPFQKANLIYSPCIKTTLLELLFHAFEDNHHILLYSSACYYPNFKQTFTLLYEQYLNDQCGCIAPLIVRQDSNPSFSNFWGELDSHGYYKRSFDYFDIVEGKKQGIWNVPYLYSSYFLSHANLTKLFKGIQRIGDVHIDPSSSFPDYAMFLCYFYRCHNIFMYIINLPPLYKQGKLLDAVELSTAYHTEALICSHQYFKMREGWLKKYITSNTLTIYNQSQKVNVHDYVDVQQTFHRQIEEPLPDIYSFSFFTETFCDLLIRVAETANQWSDGIFSKEQYDERIQNNELYPTVDVHLKELGLQDMWEDFLCHYFSKIVEALYNGIQTKKINIAFIVKYDVDKQTNLKPHHDASVYTIDIALNAPPEYEGGGVYYTRQQHAITNLKKGSCIIHPGRMTHHHAGLPITKGKRYILVSFMV